MRSPPPRGGRARLRRPARPERGLHGERLVDPPQQAQRPADHPGRDLGLPGLVPLPAFGERLLEHAASAPGRSPASCSAMPRLLREEAPPPAPGCGVVAGARLGQGILGPLDLFIGRCRDQRLHVERVDAQTREVRVGERGRLRRTATRLGPGRPRSAATGPSRVAHGPAPPLPARRRRPRPARPPPRRSAAAVRGLARPGCAAPARAGRWRRSAASAAGPPSPAGSSKSTPARSPLLDRPAGHARTSYKRRVLVKLLYMF